MSEFKEIIDYLQLVKPKTPSTKKAIEIVNENYNDTELPHEEDLTIIEEKDLQNGFYTNLGEQITTNELYLKYDGSQILYYVKKVVIINNLPTNQYKRIPLGLSDVWETLDETYLIKIDVSSTSGYYYSHEIKRIVFVNNLEDIIVSNVDVFPYLPNDLKLTNGVYKLVKEDLTNDVDKYLGNKELIKRDFNKISQEKKKLKFSKATKSGIIHLLPNIKLQSNRYILSYHYYQKGIPITWGTTDEAAINIEFVHPVSFLEYLNHTIFYDFDNISSFENNKNRALFLDLYLEIIKNILNKSSNFIDKLIVLNYVPAYIHKTQDKYYLWNILDQAINSGIIYNNGKITVEDFVVHLLEGIYLSYENKSIFLSEMLHIINDKTRLEHLHFHIDSENNVKIINLLYKAWKQTRFINPSIEENPEFKNSNGPSFLPYESQKWAGFYFSNANVKFVKQAINVAFETGRYEEVETINPKFAGGTGTAKKEIIENYNYHPFHPIYINNIEKQETTITFESIIPAFLLYVNENKAWWNNFVKTGEYIIDGITIASGFASLRAAKYFANVARLAETAEGVTAANKVAQASNILKNIKNAAGVVEISSGSVNLILKLTELDETEFGQSLSKVLFYLELITLAGELTAPLKANLKKSARETIEKSNPRIRKANRNLFDELYRITGIDELGLKILRVKNIDDIGSQGNKIIFRLTDNDGNEIGDLTRTIAEKGRKLNFNLKINGKSYPISSSTELLNPQTAKVYDLSVKHGENIMYADLNIPTQITDEFSGLGNIMLDDTLAYYLKNPKFGKVDGCFGVWVTNPGYYDGYGGASINLKQFWKAVEEQKMTYEQAAFETFTGKWAEKNGFRKASYNIDNHIKPEQVIIKFLKY